MQPEGLQDRGGCGGSGKKKKKKSLNPQPLWISNKSHKELPLRAQVRMDEMVLHQVQTAQDFQDFWEA